MDESSTYSDTCAEVTPTRFKVILADPPWMERGGGKIKRGADRHYPLMKTEDIMSMGPSVSSLCEDNCHLYLWVTNNFLPDGLRVMSAWGFRYITCVTWTKDRVGLGQYFRGKTEQLFFGVKGSGRAVQRQDENGKYIKGVTQIDAPRTKHSAKPPDTRIMIEKVSHGPYLELFARERQPGWSVWGNEIPSDVSIVTKIYD